jgi:hypothetical protein
LLRQMFRGQDKCVSSPIEIRRAACETMFHAAPHHPPAGFLTRNQ